MIYIFQSLSRFAIIILMLLYTISSFSYFTKQYIEDERAVLRRQTVYMYLIHLLAFLVLYFRRDDIRFLTYYAAQVIMITAALLLYNLLYPKLSKLVLNNMCMMLVIGLIIQTRLDIDRSMRQFMFMAVGIAFGLFVPVIVRKIKKLADIRWFYAAVGVLALAAVFAFAPETLGARRFISIGIVSLQPSEFVKITYVFFIAASLKYSTAFKNIFITSAIAGLHVILLILSPDLGQSLILVVTLVVMLYVSTRNPLYPLGGFFAGAGFSYVAYQLFPHLRVRVANWRSPLPLTDRSHQLVMSLFAIGTGSWFGMGLDQGMPRTIPVVAEDFVFSAIAEELGMIFALCFILICVSCYVMFLNVAMEIRNPFYKMIALGLGTSYIMQVFLTIGGVTGFIPHTGVTLPLISYGGSSLLSMLIVFGIIQGLYIVREDEVDEYERRRQSAIDEKQRKQRRKQGHYEEVERISGNKKQKNRKKGSFEEVPKQRVR